MKSNFVLLAIVALFNTAYTLYCDPRNFLFTAREVTNTAPGQSELTKYIQATMMGGCDTSYGKFHADLTLFSITNERYCQFYDQNPFFQITPQLGTMLDGSQRSYESLGNSFGQNIDDFGWDEGVPPFPVDVNALVMPCASCYYTDITTGTPTPPQVVCALPFNLFC